MLLTVYIKHNNKSYVVLEKENNWSLVYRSNLVNLSNVNLMVPSVVYKTLFVYNK